jgi:protein ImuB
LASRHQALVALWLSLLIDHGDRLKEPLRPAVPTLDAAQILDLVRLRLESLRLAAGVIEVEPTRVLRHQRAAASVRRKLTRDLDANRACSPARRARRRSVARAKLTDGHLRKRLSGALSSVKLPRNVLND